MGSRVATSIATNQALTTSPVDLPTIDVSYLDFVTFGFSCASAATVQNLVIGLKVGQDKDATLYASESGLPNGELTPVSMTIALANITGGSFTIPTWAMDDLTLSLSTSTGTKTLTDIWAVKEGSSSATPKT